MQRTLRRESQAVGFASLRIPVPFARTQEFLSQSNGQVAVDDHTDIRATPNEITAVAVAE